MGGGDQRTRTSVEVRLATVDDIGALIEFLGAVPQGDRTFFKEDVTAAGVVAGWLSQSDQHRLIALVDDAIVGYGAVHKGVAWSSHVGELRLVVLPEFRQRSIGRLLAQRLVVEAEDLGINKLVVEVVAGHDRLLAMFTTLGFEQEGRLRGQVLGADGEPRDLLLLSHFVDDLMATMMEWPITGQVAAVASPGDARGSR